MCIIKSLNGKFPSAWQWECNGSNLPGYHSVQFKLTRQNRDINTVNKLKIRTKSFGWIGSFGENPMRLYMYGWQADLQIVTRGA